MFPTINVVIAVAWGVGGLVCLLLGLPLVAGRIPPNPIYGVRFPESFRSVDAWYAINRFGGQRMAWWSVPQMLAGLVALFVPMESRPAVILVVGLTPLLFIIIPAFESWRFARAYVAVK